MRRTLLATLAATLMLVALTAGTALASRPVFVFQAVLTGEAERPGPGDADAIGHAVIMIEPGIDRVCWVVSWNRVDGTVVASHIHGQANESQPAPVLVPLFVNQTFGSLGIDRGCTINNNLSAVFDAIIATPQLYYVNVHSTPSFGPGAIRGQLD